ncbi:ABC transporter permease subunit, partial [Candidatus Aerophobetes bacterium]|nr:ABC transporter permease subunit [Candidatus Aerophobetes bacterium]
QMAKVFGSKRKRILFHILLPGMSPLIISSARAGVAFAWKSTVLAEFLGSSSGIGFMLSTANNLLDTSQVFAWALILILAMLGLEYLVIDPVRGRINRWIKCAGS